MIQLFISGNNSYIDEVFRKDGQKSEAEAIPSNCHMIELRVTVQTILNKVVELEKCEKEHKKRNRKITK